LIADLRDNRNGSNRPIDLNEPAGRRRRDSHAVGGLHEYQKGAGGG
jgi:hypothetical protein